MRLSGCLASWIGNLFLNEWFKVPREGLVSCHKNVYDQELVLGGG